MHTAEVVKAIPLDEPVPPRFASAAELLERAVRTGCPDANVHYLLALAYKRQGQTAEARAALRQISRPDAAVVLQMGLLSLRERQPAQAEEEFARAWEMDPASYPAGYNLLMTRLTLGKIADGLSVMGRLLPLAPSPDERSFLAVLEALLHVVQTARQRGEDAALPECPANLGGLTAADEQRLVNLARGLGDVDTAHALLQALAAVHPRRPAVQEAYVEATMARAKDLLDRCRWGEAERLLSELTREHVTLTASSRPTLGALQNLLGCCACLNQDFAAGVKHFTGALKLAGNDARIHQNLALTHELQDQLGQAEPHWNRYFDLLDGRLPVPPGQPDYAERLAYEGLTRLANRFSRREQWQSALGYAQRAHRLRPRDADTLELLFHLYNQAKRPQDARRALQQLRELRPNEPQYDLYELDLIEVKGLGDIDRLLTEIERIRKRYPGDVRVEERAVAMAGNVIPLMGNLCNQLTDQLSKVIDQVRNVPSYQQVNWPAVREVMHDLQREFLRLRRITTKCLPLVTHEEHRRVIRELTEHIDRKIEVCRDMGA